MANKADLASGIVSGSVGTSSTTIVLESGYGSTMPATPFFATVSPPMQLSTRGNSEIVSVTGRSSDTLTVVRAQKGTTAKNIDNGWVFVNGVYTDDLNAFNGVVTGEIPSGTINSSNTVFVTANPYIGASISVYVNGLKQLPGTHYTETDPSTGTFTFNEAPITGDNVLVDYIFSTTSSTNSDTVDGYHANATPTANTIPVLDSTGVLPNSALGGAWNSWTPTFTGVSGGTLNYAKFRQVGKTVDLKLSYVMAGANVSGDVLFTLPVTATALFSTASPIGTTISVDAGTGVYQGALTQSDTTTAQLRVINTATGTYAVQRPLSSTVPFTWGAGDSIEIQATYEAA